MRTQGCRLRSNPGLKLANAFGVIVPAPWQLWKQLTSETSIMCEDDRLGASPDAEFVEKI